MGDLAIEFAFGAAFGKDNASFNIINKKYDTICSEAVSWLSDTSTSTEGHGWLVLPDADLSLIKEAGEWLKSYDSIVHIGIGGSALGNLMLNQAILGDLFNEEDINPKFYLTDNPDPVKMTAIWNRVKNGSVALIGVSKSGTTVETMSQFLWFRDNMIKSGIDADQNILVITDPKSGIFRNFSQKNKSKVLDLPQSVGGRYSVLSAAGLLSAYVMGINIDALLEGAKIMRDILFSTESIDNPACILAKLNLFHEKSGRPMSVIMPYSSEMSYFAEWIAQLWSESLGKEGKGTTLVRAVGAIDQHSQIQLYTEGPDDKFFTIINVKTHANKICVPAVDSEALSPLSYMTSTDFGTLLGLEAISTASAIIKSGRPIVWIEIEALNEKTVGALIFFYEYMTALTGRISGVNPFNQPGVEQAKNYTYGLMGRRGFEKDAVEAQKWFKLIKNKSIKFNL